MNTHPLVLRITLSWPGRLLLGALLALLLQAVAARAERYRRPDATFDLRTSEGVRRAGGAWRYCDTVLRPIDHRAPGPDLKASGPPNRSFDFVPDARAADFDDGGWDEIAAESLESRRGSGRLSFGWYRIAVTLPERVGGLDTRGSTVVFEIVVDDYAEVWVNGQASWVLGQSGGSVAAGWNAPNRVVLTRDARPGDRFQIAVLGINGPISAHPDTYIWVRSATLDFFAPGRLDRARTVPLQVERKDPALETAVPAGATLERLADGFTFTEGPVWVPDRGRMGGGYLLFSDPDNNVIYRMSPWGEASVYLTHSGYAGEDTGLYRQPGSNGLALDSEGRLTLAQHGNRRVVRLERNGLTTVLADRFEGKRLNSPNDLVYRSDGALFFTDPPFGLPKVHEDPRRELPHSGIYSVKDGKVRLVAADLRGPNGLAFSPEERFLYVGNWDENRKVVQRYPVHADATVGAGELFHDFTRVAGEDAIDGLKVDRRGNVYVSGPGGLWVLSPEGKALGLLKGPEHVHNMAWGDADYRSLYLAARSGIYRLRLTTPGSGSFDGPLEAMAHSPLR